MAKRQFDQGVYYPKNAGKYIGKTLPVYRSSWEKRMFKYLDESKSVISWASEPLRIPYKNPVTGRASNYVPDILIKYEDRDGKQIIELIEIKPLSQTILEAAKSKKDKLAVAVNQAKWQAASAWCRNQGIVFRVLSEKDLFGVKRK